MKQEQYHFIGIGGIGMSGLAKILMQKGEKVSGSDTSRSAVIDQLMKEGAVIHIGHAAEQVPAFSKVIYSSAVLEHNPEYKLAKEQQMPLLHRSHLLQELMKGKESLLVTGTHGKTTTSSLLAHTLVVSGEEPSFAIGGIVQSLASNAAHGKGHWFVAEADESDGSFLSYSPYGAIITNVDLDHLDFWKTEENLKQGFINFEKKVERKDYLFWCADDPILRSLSFAGIAYGFSSQADLQIVNPRYRGWKSVFNIKWNGKEYKDIEVPLIGNHNVLNAAAVFGLCVQIGLSEEKIRYAFSLFQGVGRRAEKKGEYNSIEIYDDYAHHPTEIETTLQALRHACAGRRLVVLFQPHRYSRTKDCFDLFGPALKTADVLILTDVYAAGEAPIPSIDAAHLQNKINEQLKRETYYFPKDQIMEHLTKMISPGDVIVTMGAGDITQLGPKILQKLQECH
jgi:UDP-N-acetylmuramate--alanine ligase